MPFTQDSIQIDQVKVHLLHYQDFDSSTYLDHLTDDEKERYLSFAHPERRKQFAATRILRHRIFGFEHIHYDPSGAPYINKEGFISISHSSGVVGIALCKGFKVGLDLETIRSKAAKLSRKFLSDREISMLDSTDPVEMTKAWSVKEVLYKLAGRKGVHFRTDLLIDKVGPNQWEGQIVNPDKILRTKVCTIDHVDTILSVNICGFE
ncbi:MAG: 4'-phosphopantetheinyl transferase family protein [Bacteroidota bacterium]